MKTKAQSRKEYIRTSISIKKNDSSFITVECLLAFDNYGDKKQVVDLMRQFSSALTA